MRRQDIQIYICRNQARRFIFDEREIGQCYLTTGLFIGREIIRRDKDLDGIDIDLESPRRLEKSLHF